MRRLTAVLAAPLALALVLTGCGDDDEPADEPAVTETDAAEEPADAEEPAETEEPADAEEPADGAAGTTYDLSLTGAAVPGGGAEEGTGQATLTLDPAAGEICFQVTVEDVAPVEAMHIHEGAEGESGGVFVGLEGLGDDNTVDSCITAESSQVQQILDDPASFYLNLHNADFPDGALRAQLA